MKRICIPICLLMAVACQDGQSTEGSDGNLDSLDVHGAVTDSNLVVPAAFDGPVISERIDGPANVRQAADGKILFSIENNVPVTAREPEKGWIEIGVWIDIASNDQKLVKKGSSLYRDGKLIGQALEDVQLYQTFTINDKKRGVLNGFTAVTNIHPSTILENAFTELAKNKNSLSSGEMKELLNNYQFEDFNGLTEGNKGYVFYESGLLDPTAAPRFWPIFKGDELLVVFHLRKMDIPGVRTEAFNDGYITVFSNDEAGVNELKKKFVSFMQSAG